MSAGSDLGDQEGFIPGKPVRGGEKRFIRKGLLDCDRIYLVFALVQVFSASENRSIPTHGL